MNVAIEWDKCKRMASQDERLAEMLLAAKVEILAAVMPDHSYYIQLRQEFWNQRQRAEDKKAQEKRAVEKPAA